MNHLVILNKLKSLALGVDTLFKETKAGDIKFHHAVAAVYQSVFNLMESENFDALREIFGEAADDCESMGLMRQVLSEFVDGFVAAGTDEAALNRVYNDFRILDKEGRFPLRIEPTEESSIFHGHIVVTNSFNIEAPVEVDTLVNVTLTIDRADASQLVAVIRPQLQSIGLIEGRLTGTQDTQERHVSLALRIPYNEMLGQEVEKINNQLRKMTLSTAAELKVVTPTDIRTKMSALGLLTSESCEILHSWQAAIHKAAKKEGNRLPALCITHGNCPVEPAGFEDLAKLRAYAPQMDSILEQYRLDLARAFSIATATTEEEKSEALTAPAISIFAQPDNGKTATVPPDSAGMSP